MSDNWITFVSSNPDWLPSSDDVIKQLEDFARSEFPDADEVKTEIHDQITFVSPGTNLETVSCPSCQSDLIEWWQDQMETNEDEKFISLSYVVPCCGTTISLNNLEYDWPAAFGRFQLDVMNPNMPDAPKSVVEAFETIASTTFQIVRTHI